MAEAHPVVLWRRLVEAHERGEGGYTVDERRPYRLARTQTAPQAPPRRCPRARQFVGAPRRAGESTCARLAGARPLPVAVLARLQPDRVRMGTQKQQVRRHAPRTSCAVSRAVPDFASHHAMAARGSPTAATEPERAWSIQSIGGVRSVYARGGDPPRARGCARRDRGCGRGCARRRPAGRACGRGGRRRGGARGRGRPARGRAGDRGAR